MVVKLTDYIKCYDNMVDEFFCQSVIEAFKDSESSYLDREQRPSFSELNISKKYLEGDPLWKPIQSKMTKVLIDTVQIYMQDLGIEPDFPAKYAFEEFRVKRYRQRSNDEFADHVDVGDHNSARRFLVCFLYLNDVEEGGTTDFPKIHHAINPKCARILVFPPNWMYRHAGRPVTKGTKYILGSYLHYL